MGAFSLAGEIPLSAAAAALNSPGRASNAGRAPSMITRVHAQHAFCGSPQHHCAMQLPDERSHRAITLHCCAAPHAAARLRAHLPADSGPLTAAKVIVRLRCCACVALAVRAYYVLVLPAATRARELTSVDPSHTWHPSNRSPCQRVQGERASACTPSSRARHPTGGDSSSAPSRVLASTLCHALATGCVCTPLPSLRMRTRRRCLCRAAGFFACFERSANGDSTKAAPSTSSQDAHAPSVPAQQPRAAPSEQAAPLQAAAAPGRRTSDHARAAAAPPPGHIAQPDTRHPPAGRVAPLYSSDAAANGGDVHKAIALQSALHSDAVRAASPERASRQILSTPRSHSDQSDERLDGGPESTSPLIRAAVPQQSGAHAAGVTAGTVGAPARACAASHGFKPTEAGRCPFLHGARSGGERCVPCQRGLGT